MSTKQSQTFRILQNFEEKDWQDFKHYFESPFFFNPRGKDAVLPDFLEILYTFFKEEATTIIPTPNDDFLWKKLGQTGETDVKYINNLLSELDRHADIFFRHQWLKENTSLDKGVWTLQYLNKRDLDNDTTRKYFVNKLKKFEKKFHAVREKSSFHWYHRFVLEIEKSLFYRVGDKIDRDKYIKEALRNLDFFYLHEKLKFVGVLIDRSKILDADISDLQLDTFLSYLETIKPIIWNESPVFRLYYHMVMGLTQKDGTAHYEELQKDFFQHALEIPARERRNFREVIINFFLRQINLGKSGYKEKLFSFYVELLDQGFFITQGKLAYGTYRNIVAISLDIGEWAWAKAFIEKYEKKIIPFHRAEDLYAYCQALLYFYKKEPDYPTAINWLNQMSSKFILFEIWRRTLLVICYYETQDSLALPVDAEINNFKEYLRSKSMKERTLAYHNFVRFIGRILKTATFNRDKGAYNRLKREIEDTNQIVHREWLLKKLEARTQ